MRCNNIIITFIFTLACFIHSHSQDELVTNGHFTSNGTGWTWGMYDSATYSPTVSGGELNIQMLTLGQADWSAQVLQGGIALLQGGTYRMSVDARSDSAGRVLTLGLGMQTSPYTVYREENFLLTSEMATYEAQFTMSGPTDLDAKVNISFGSSLQPLVVDNISVTEVVGGGPFTIDIGIEGDGQVYVTPQLDEYPAGTPIRIIAVAGAGCNFFTWDGNGFGSDLRSDTIDVTVDRNIYGNAYFFEPGNELISNGTFTSDSAGWNFYRWEGAWGQYGYIGGAMQFAMTVAGADIWNIWFEQENIPLRQGHNYVFSFDAGVTPDARIEAGVAPNHEGSQPYFKMDSTLIAGGIVHYAFIFSPRANDDTAIVYFKLGEVPGTITIDNVSLVADASVKTATPALINTPPVTLSLSKRDGLLLTFTTGGPGTPSLVLYDFLGRPAADFSARLSRLGPGPHRVSLETGRLTEGMYIARIGDGKQVHVRHIAVLGR